VQTTGQRTHHVVVAATAAAAAAATAATAITTTPRDPYVMCTASMGRTRGGGLGAGACKAQRQQRTHHVRGSKLAELLAEETKFKAAIEKVTVSGCKVTQETAAQLLAAANEASRVRLRTHQLLAFSKAFHERLGSECLLQAVRSMQIYGGESLRMFVSDMGTSSCVRS
jgi:hypothetical protein